MEGHSFKKTKEPLKEGESQGEDQVLKNQLFYSHTTDDLLQTMGC
jgi:hypothetical protein